MKQYHASKIISFKDKENKENKENNNKACCRNKKITYVIIRV